MAAMEQRESQRSAMKRRGILAAAGAVVAGIVAKQSSVPVAASTPMLIADTETAGVSNSVVGPSTVASAGGFSSKNAVLIGNGANGNAFAGVCGTTSFTTTPVPPEICGVFGPATFGDTGVLGTTASTGTGVKGTASASGTGVAGSSISGYGVYGASTSGIGTRGDTNASGSFGVLGVTTAVNSIALGGITNADNSSCFSGGTSNPNAFAAFFQGHVQVTQGAFDVIPMGNKHGLAEHPDGTYRTFYSVESPECWVEDFGEGTITAGKAEVKLDTDFATLVHTDHYHVFLTEHSDHHLHVSQRTASGFTAEADTALAVLKGKKTADLNGTFSWRVVAKPKTTAKVDRLAKATVGTFPLPDVSKLPKAPPPSPVKKP